MKRIAVIVVLSVAVVYLLITRNQQVSAKGSNPNFITQEQFETTMQSNLNLVWDDIQVLKDRMAKNDQNITEINERLGRIEKSLGL